MTVDPSATTILCFGDSNTNGTSPNKSGRFPSNVRWTGQLQNLLGEKYYVIEEGLGGRLTGVDHFSDKQPGRNGLEYYRPALESHLPLDYVIIMLGTNDVKNVYDRSVNEIADTLEEYIQYTLKKVDEKGLDRPAIILASPAHLDERCYQEVFDQSSVEKSKKLGTKIKDVAERHGCQFLDAAKHGVVGEDGIHLTADSHESLAKALLSKIA